MSIYTLPIEIIEKIVSDIENDDDLKSLYHLCLTNRTLCQITIPYLWKKSLIDTKRKKDGLRSDHWEEVLNGVKVISIIITFIKRGNIKYFLKNKCKKYYTRLKPLYNYPSLIKQIDIVFLFRSVKYWICKNDDKLNHKINNKLLLTLIKTIFSTIINRTELETIHISHYQNLLYRGDYYEMFDFYGYNLLGYYQKYLTKLKKIKIKGDIGIARILNRIMNVAHNLTKISVENTEEGLQNHRLMRFLLSQRKLMKVTIRGLNYERDDTISHLSGTVSSSLESLKIVECYISDNFLRFFINCNKLRKLEMLNVHFILQNKILEDIIFPNLEELKIISLFSFQNEIEENSFNQFFMHHIKNLWKLEIYQSANWNSSISNFVLNIPLLISKSDCSNLKHLSLQIDDETHFSTFLIILKNSKNLKKLELNNNLFNNNNNSMNLNNQFLKDISINCDNENLKLYLKKWEISISNLKILLTQNRLCLKKLDCFVYNGNPYHVERLIQKYKEFNSRIISYTSNDPYRNFYGKECDQYYRVMIEWV